MASWYEKITHAISSIMIGRPEAPARSTPLLQIDPAPDGLRLLYTASTVPEAEMLRQLLIEEGFHVEHVAASGMGIFGQNGNPYIYVPEREWAVAHEFLRHYLEPQPEDGPAVE